MTPNRAKGTRYETEVVRFLQGRHFQVERTGSASSPHGDIAGVPFCSTEVKNQREQRLGIWLDQSKASAVRQGHLIPIVIHKRRMKNVAESYVTLELQGFVELLERVLDAI